MNNKLLPFTTTLMGSLPRSQELLQLKDKLKSDNSLFDEYRKKVEEETKNIVAMFDRTGIDVIVTGELSRDNYMSYVAEYVDSIKLMSMKEILSLTSSSEEFSESLENMDANDDSMNSPICIGKIDTETKLDVDELKLLKKFSDKPFKATLPSPYLLTRSMWLKEVTKEFYKNRKELGADIVKLLINEIKRLVEVGAVIIQIDEPILSEVVFTREKGDTSFYWGALSEKVKVDRELQFAKDLLEPIFEEIRKYENVLSSMHVCRGNWTTDETVLLEGAYDKLGNFFDSLDVDMLALEFSTPRAGEVDKLFENNFLKKKIYLGFGCLNPRSTEVETPEWIVEQVKKVLKYLPPERIWLNPDCGFATFSKRALNPYDIIEKKIESMVKAAKILREEYCK